MAQCQSGEFLEPLSRRVAPVNRALLVKAKPEEKLAIDIVKNRTEREPADVEFFQICWMEGTGTVDD